MSTLRHCDRCGAQLNGMRCDNCAPPVPLVTPMGTTLDELEVDRLRNQVRELQVKVESYATIANAARRERDAARERAGELQLERDKLWMSDQDNARLVEKYRKENDALRVLLEAKPDPEGAIAAQRELAWMRPKLTDIEAALARATEHAGWGFTGPCVHGRDPFDRCDSDDVPAGVVPCGDLEGHQAAARVEREACAVVLEQLPECPDVRRAGAAAIRARKDIA